MQTSDVIATLALIMSGISVFFARQMKELADRQVEETTKQANEAKRQADVAERAEQRADMELYERNKPIVRIMKQQWGEQSLRVEFLLGCRRDAVVYDLLAIEIPNRQTSQIILSFLDREMPQRVGRGKVVMSEPLELTVGGTERMKLNMPTLGHQLRTVHVRLHFQMRDHSVRAYSQTIEIQRL